MGGSTRVLRESVLQAFSCRTLVDVFQEVNVVIFYSCFAQNFYLKRDKYGISLLIEWIVYSDPYSVNWMK